MSDEIIVALNRSPEPVNWLKGRGFKHHRFLLKNIDPTTAEIHGPVVYDHERGWLPDPEQTVHDRHVPTQWITWVD